MFQGGPRGSGGGKENHAGYGCVAYYDAHPPEKVNENSKIFLRDFIEMFVMIRFKKFV